MLNRRRLRERSNNNYTLAVQQIKCNEPTFKRFLASIEHTNPFVKTISPLYIDATNGRNIRRFCFQLSSWLYNSLPKDRKEILQFIFSTRILTSPAASSVIRAIYVIISCIIYYIGIIYFLFVIFLIFFFVPISSKTCR